MSEAVGGVLSASTVARCRDEGLGPVGRDVVDHYRALAPFVGRGRSYDVAALRMAALGYPTRRLRTVLLSPYGSNPERGSKVFDVLKAIIAGSAERIAVTAPLYDPSLGMPETPAEEAMLIADGVLGDVEDLASGETGLVLDDYRKVAVDVVATHVGPAEPGREVYADEFAGYMEQFASALNNGRSAIEAASLEELAISVATAADAWSRTFVRKLPIGEEDSWRIIGALAPAAGVFVQLVQDVISQIGGS
jgi:hypothetical protein